MVYETARIEAFVTAQQLEKARRVWEASEFQMVPLAMNQINSRTSAVLNSQGNETNFEAQLAAWQQAQAEADKNPYEMFAGDIQGVRVGTRVGIDAQQVGVRLQAIEAAVAAIDWEIVARRIRIVVTSYQMWIDQLTEYLSVRLQDETGVAPKTIVIDEFLKSQLDVAIKLHGAEAVKLAQPYLNLLTHFLLVEQEVGYTAENLLEISDKVSELQPILELVSSEAGQQELLAKFWKSDAVLAYVATGAQKPEELQAFTMERVCDELAYLIMQGFWHPPVAQV